MDRPALTVERVFREEYGRAVAALVRTFGDIHLVEEAVQDAFATAVQRWPSEGIPPSPAGCQLDRQDLSAEAIRLGRLLAELMPDEPEALGLLALMVLVEARRPARVAPGGELVRLADQDRSRWDRELIAEGQALVRRCLRRNRPGPYQIQAAINAVHSDAPSVAGTDWGQIKVLYDLLMALAPSPVVALHRAVAVAELPGLDLGRDAAAGPRAALALVDELDLDGYYLFHAVRADLLRRMGRYGEAAAAYEAALTRTANAAERDFLQRRLRETRRAVTGPGGAQPA